MGRIDRSCETRVLSRFPDTMELQIRGLPLRSLESGELRNDY